LWQTQGFRLREGELVALRWGDIQFGETSEDPNRYILVRRNFDWRSRKFLTPKSGKSRRVDLGRDLRQVLLDLRDQRFLEAYTRGQASIADELVFRTVTGSMPDIRGNVVQRYILPTLEAAELRRVRFHDLRHTFGSLLIQAGAPLTYVRDQMGHSSIKITVDIYGHLIPSADIQFMDALGAEKSASTAETSRAKNATPAQPSKKPIRVNLVQVVQNHGVGDGIRTRDVQIHSLALYQLSYTHHFCERH
jgi:integrase